MSETDTLVPELSPEPTVIRDPFVRAKPSDFYWVQLKPVFKARVLVHTEKLAQIAVTQEKAGSLELLRLQFRFEGEALPDIGNRLEVLVDHQRQRVRFGPISGVSIQPAQRGLGTFMLAQLIHWCQRYCGDYAITPINLRADDFKNADARAAFENILSRAGFTISTLEEGSGNGAAQANRVNDLIGSWNTEKIQPLQIGSLLDQLREHESLNQKQAAQMNKLQNLIASYKRTDIGNRFAIGCLIVFSIFQALMLLWVVLR
ncbi:MAG TPA: hypothetical protein ENH72_05535 [Pseudomonas sabulinigri]|jgi:hypothetical protein|uniref:Uncharacterized protein n=1 Tax=marine sediment metagenome TaxID=412755 RepID=A0A0F9V942_9ZZZZ|nr:hypothetical protein [Halopseudomonas sabulinigri]HEC50512.1 hypothetical protein [Halopseudomonas sabulinigri]|tara:strand:- start:27083 stop:27862 length:780 start_codon:yes stop_codon:yes gene_type:complete